MLSNEMDTLKEIDDAELFKLLCGKKKRNFTTGPVIKPVRFNDNSLKQQLIPNVVVVKALNNTSRPQTATIKFYNLGILTTKDKGSKNSAVEAQKILFFSQTVQVQPQSTVFLPVDITSVTEYEVQVLDAPVGMYFSTEFLPSTPIPTAQAGSISPNQNTPGAVIDSHIVTYSHQFVLLEEPAEF